MASCSATPVRMRSHVRLLEFALMDDVEQFLRLRGAEVEAVAADELERVPRGGVVARP